MIKRIIITSVLSLSSTMSFAAPVAKAPVSGFARSFIMGSELSGATITILETGEKFKTDSYGHFGPIYYPIGKPITLQLEKWNYKTTQSGTFIVPKEGLTGPYYNITFQVPTIETFYILKSVVGGTEDKNSCHVTSTITAFHKTMDDIPQGEEHAKVTLNREVSEKPFYFGIFESGPLKGKTNPFAKGLTDTSEDGGIAYFNLPPSDKLYVMSAEKDGIAFTKAHFRCTPGAFINISPPGGPMALTQHD